jgi:hypothetical protein
MFVSIAASVFMAAIRPGSYLMPSPTASVRSFGAIGLVALVAASAHGQCGVTAGSCFNGTDQRRCSDRFCCMQECDFDTFCCFTARDGISANTAWTHCAPEIASEPMVHPTTRSTYVMLSASSWASAQPMAESRGGYLVSIGNAAENSWVFANATGNPIIYASWAPGEPSNSNGQEDFVHMYLFGPLGDALPALVEIPRSGDLNRDGIIDAADLGIVLGSWGPCPTANACVARTTPGTNQPACAQCVCIQDPDCCSIAWDAQCVLIADVQCQSSCLCD